MPKDIPWDTWNSIREIYLSVKSIRKTAEELGISKTGVEYALKRMGVSRFPRNRTGSDNSSRKSIKPGSASYKVRDPELMRRFYVDERKSTTDIGKILGLTPNTVITGLRQCGIVVRSRAEGIKGKPHPNSQGAKHRDWKGGITGWRKRARERLNPVFTRPVTERDGFKCKWCYSKGPLVAHHHKRSFARIYRVALDRVGREDEEKLIEEIVSEHKLDDGITLCKRCHDRHHKENGK